MSVFWLFILVAIVFGLGLHVFAFILQRFRKQEQEILEWDDENFEDETV